MMKFFRLFRQTVFLLAVAGMLICPGMAGADENIALYGLKGYTYTFSPLVVDGLHLQAGAVFGNHDRNSLKCRKGYVLDFPVSLTYGDGDWWEAAVSTHFEYYRNTDSYWDGQDVDRDENGIGDLFVGGKIRALGQDRGQMIDLSLMPYALIPTGNRDKGIADLYRYVQTDEDEVAWGLNLLLGRRWERFYLAANLGINYMDTDVSYMKEKAVMSALTLEYQIREDLTSYIEFINNENKNRFNCPECSPCYDADSDADIRELGIGMAWLRGLWGLKLHVGAGLTDTSPDVRVIALINRNLWR